MFMTEYAKTVSCIILLLLGFSCKSKKETLLDCSQLKTGKYEYRNRFTNGRIRIQRNDSVQTEIENNGIGMNFKISWPSSCEYTLELLSFANRYSEEKPCGPCGGVETRVEVSNKRTR